MIIIRDAVVEDIESTVDVHIKTWQSTYSGIIHDETLKELDKNRDEKIKRLRKDFGTLEVDGVKINQAVVVKDNRVIGFVTFGKCRESKLLKLENASEIYAIYVLENYQGKNIGKRLLHYAVKKLREVDFYDKLVIWTLKENKNKGFYERLGGKQTLEKVIDINDQKLDVIGFVFDRLDKLESNTTVQEN